jgi:hypothetical protein
MRAQATRIGTFVAVVLVILAARDGAAQSSGSAKPWFVGASVAGNIDNTTWMFSGSEHSGGALAVGLAGGTNFAQRWSLQVEGEWPTLDQTTVHQWSYGSATYVGRTTLRTPTVAVLFGVHWRLPKRVDVALQFGPSFLNQQWGDEQQTLVDGTVVESHQSSRSHWYLRASVGGEVAVSVTPRVALIGQLRLHLVHLGTELSPAIVRPAVGVRVRF